MECKKHRYKEKKIERDRKIGIILRRIDKNREINFLFILNRHIEKEKKKE
jgi:hypothetical protein